MEERENGNDRWIEKQGLVQENKFSHTNKKKEENKSNDFLFYFNEIK